MYFKKLLGTTALVSATALVGAAATQDVNSRWYRKLKKPDFQPPPQAFPIVWPLLYASIALASAAVLTAKARRLAASSAPTAPTTSEPADGYRPALVLNLFLNAAWSWTFFRAHNLPLALCTAVGLAASSADLVRRTGGVNRGLGVALVPYAAWCTFAAALTARIRSLNS